jgi:hypothetical protein
VAQALFSQQSCDPDLAVWLAQPELSTAPAGVSAPAAYLRGHWSLDPFLFAARTPLELPSLCVAEPLLASSLKRRSRAVGAIVTVASDGPLTCRSCISARLVVPLRLARLRSHPLPSPRSEHPTPILGPRLPACTSFTRPLMNQLSCCCRLRDTTVHHQTTVGPIICSERKRLRGRSRSAQSHPPGGCQTAESGILPQAQWTLRPHRTVAPPSQTVTGSHPSHHPGIHISRQQCITT